MSFLNEQWWQIMKWHLFIVNCVIIQQFFKPTLDNSLESISFHFILMFSFPCLRCHGGAQTVSYFLQKFKPHPARLNVFDLTFGGLGILHGISNCCPDMNCFVFCSNILRMNGSTGSGGGKKLRAGHVIRVNNKTSHFFRFSSHQSLSSW